MAKWVIRGILNGEKRKWSVEAPNEQSARTLAESKGVQVLSVVADSQMVVAKPMPPAISKPQEVIAVPKVERCGNCDSVIGRMETPHVWQDTIICHQCYRKFTEQITAASPPFQHPVQPQIIMMPTAPPASPASSPIIHVSTTSVNTNIVKTNRGCISSIIHGIFSLIAIAIFIAGAIALICYFVYYQK